MIIQYAGMDALTLGVWIALATVAGLAARQIVQGKALLGLWSDMLIGLVGAFALGWVMRRFGFDLSQTILSAVPGVPSGTAIWIDVFITSFVGAMVLRLVLRIAKQ